MNDVISTSPGSAIDHSPHPDVLEEREPTVFTVLADRARGHPPAHLWGAALFGAADAIAVLFAYPAAWWIAAGATTLCAFGVWGLADQALIEDPYRSPNRASRVIARVVRGGSAGLGVISALAAAFGLIGASFGGLIH